MSPRVDVSKAKRCAIKILPGVLVFYQLSGVVVWFSLDTLGTALLGAFTAVFSVLFAVSAWLRPPLCLSCLVSCFFYYVFYLFTGSIWILLWFSSYQQRCADWMELSERVSPQLTEFKDCDSYELYKWLLTVGLLAFLIVQASTVTLLALLIRKEIGNIPDYQKPVQRRLTLTLLMFIAAVLANDMDDSSSPTKTSKTTSPTSSHPIIQHLSNPKTLFGVSTFVGALFGVVVFITVLVLVIHPGNEDMTKDGMCPANHGYFLDSPEENDLDCCAWHSEATCCRRKVCSGGYKPDATDDYSGKCHELLGLLNCAPCKYNAGLFFSNYTSQGNPWEEGVIAVCPSFCSELFHACYLDPLQDGEQDPMGWDCAFGPSTKCAMGDSSETGQYENTVDGQMQFCQDWGLVVREKDCYSSAMRPLPLLFSSVLALLLLALVVL
ncbi:hypothetical protein QOT17_014482 [Balamuthia mandrillaris]